MAFEINAPVVYPALGVGRIAALISKSFGEAEKQEYYEVVGNHKTAWVKVSDAAAQGLRPLATKAELPHYRDVLRGKPVALNTDPRQRQTDFRDQLRQGTLQGLCEVVRDLSARGWLKPLGEYDSAGLRRGLLGVCQEWAAADGVTLDEATAEVNLMLQTARQTFQVAAAPKVGPPPRAAAVQRATK